MAAVRGKDFKMYRNTDSPIDGTPTWVLMTNVRDVTRKLEKAVADASVRGSSFKMQVGTMNDLSIDFQMVYDGGSDAIAVEDAYFDGTDLELLLLDGSIATVGSKGIRVQSQVTSFTVNEALEDVGLIDVTVVPGYAPSNLPRRVEVAVANAVVDA